MYRFKIYLFFLLTIICSIKGDYRKNAKVLSKNGHIIFESGIDRNITFRLRGKSWLNLNNINILSAITNGEISENVIHSNGEDNLRLLSEVRDLRNRLQGPNGLENRISILETNSTSATRRNLLRIVRTRVSRLEERLQLLQNGLRSDKCESNPCQNGGTCIRLYDDFVCECPKQFEGKTCSADVNECALYVGTDLGCQNGAQCINIHGGYNCICSSGWIGVHCNKKRSDCISSQNSDLCGHGTCINTHSEIGYTCICDQGWKTNGLTPACNVDVDECADSKPPCFTSCMNLIGSFACTPCPAGFTGNGVVCTDIDECAHNNGGCSLNPSVPCLNTHGSFRCGECPIGWTGDGKTCRRNENGACSTNICHPLATCNEMSNTIICSCPPHMTGHGVGPNGCTLLSIDPCGSSPCLNGGTCKKNGTSYYCGCPPGFIEPNCSPDNNCHSNPCQNGGTCHKIDGVHKCICRSGFVGQHCENRLSRCGGVLSNPSGSLKYPANQQFDHNTRCAWVIRTNSSKVLNVTFEMFEMPSSPGCSSDWLQINDGPSTASIMFGRFCGSDLPKGGNICSSRNTLYLWFRTVNSSSRAAFELSWNSIDPVCGGSINFDTHGTIASPGSPGNYPPNRNCKWILNAPEGSRIQLNFFSLYLENHNTCDYDFLAIYEGSSIEDPLLEKFCNTSNPAPYTAPSNQILIHFHSDDEGSDKGFQIHYAVVPGYPGCGGTYTATRGEFGSPVLNRIVPQITICEYVIHLPVGNRIELQFDEFNLEYTMGCLWDYVKIFEGSEDENNLVGRWCGRNKPRAYKSQSNTLRVKLYTNHLVENHGFRASYQIACGGVFEEEGELTSPLYPKSYYDDRICLYEIKAPLSKAIKLEFKDFEIEGYSVGPCNYDFVEIYDGIDEPPVAKYCGSTLPPLTIGTQNYMLIKFHADINTSGRGFRAEFKFIDKGCGGILTKSNMTIIPPINPRTNLYEHLQRCTWTIVAPPEHHIQLYWTSFELEDSRGCYFDYVEIYDNYTKEYSEKSDRNREVGRFCGEQFPPDMLSIQNVVTIVFQTDDADSGRGFTLSYEFKDSAKMCGGNHFAPIGILRSPGWPGEYPSYLNCTWVLNVPAGQQILLTVKHFSLEPTTNCYADYLEIRNDPTGKSAPLGKHCGKGIPPEIHSITNQLHIIFISDSSVVDSGFEIEWDGTLSGCGGTITSYTSVITSPNYPQPYMHNAECQWHIVTNKGSEIKIVLDIQLEHHHSCVYDYLEIFESHGSSRNKLGKYCSSKNPIELTAHSNEVFLKMITDSSTVERGFSLRYTTNCHVSLTSLHGVIESPNFPYEYPMGLECEWTISAPKGNKISLAFSHFELESYAQVCDYDYITITDPKGPKSLTYCHEIPPVMTSESNITIISFITDNSLAKSGFRLEYEIIGCVETLTKPNGEIISPSYPNYYPNDMECKWHIEIEFGNSIEITIFELDIEGGTNCTNDGILITSARNTSHVLGRYCGKSLKNQTITVNSHEILITFYSNESKNGKGFRALYKSVPKQCGGRMSTSSGFVMSPNYPHNYDSNLECEWLIETSEDRTINLTFIELDLEEISECFADVLEIYDSPFRTNATLLLATCERELPERKTWSSSGSHLLISFKTDSDTEAKGFKLFYEENCGRTIRTNSSGRIILESYHKKTGLCVWTITADLGSHIRFVAIHLLVNRNLTKNQNSQSSVENCMTGSIEVFDGEGEDAALRTKICSTQILPIFSYGSALTIKLPLDEISEFQGSYDVLDNYCGETLNSYTGLLSSPAYPESYPVNADCVWKIETTAGNSAQINFQAFDIAFSSDCNEDYLEVRKENESGSILGVLCGQEIPAAIVGPNIWMKFHSDNDNVRGGFLAKYQYAQHTEVNGYSGSIGSPRYPSIRLFENPFSWRITVDRNYAIEIQLKDLNEDIFSYNTIYDGYDETANVMEYSHEMRTLFSNTNIIYIISYRGPFWIDWQSIPRTTVDDKNSSCSSKNIVVKSGENFRFSSPGYPDGYDNNLSCNWTFLAEDETDHPVLRFQHIELEDIYSCSSDFVRISTSKDSMTWKEKAKLCNIELYTLPEYHGEPYLKVEFVTDFSVNKTGFSGLVSTYCGSSLTTSSGIINGTKYGSTFQPNCTWQISVRRGRKLQLKFTDFDLPSYNDAVCESYVLIKNGIDEDSPILGKGRFCGNNIDTLPQTSSNKAFVKFIRKTFQDFRWTLEYEEVTENCGQHITLSRANNSIISSPNYPHIPNAHSECVWIFTAPAGKRITVNFIEKFQLTSSKDCANEYVEIRSGATSYAKPIGRFCRSKPNTVHSIENVIQIKYFTDVSEPKIGFKAEVSIDKCGGSYHELSGTILSDNYPHGSVLSKALCEYVIISPIGSTIYLNFSDIHLPSSYEVTCNDTNHLKIYSLIENEDGEEIEELIVPSICGVYNPLTAYEINSNKVVIRYKIVAQQLLYRGFKLTYNSTRGQCGKELNSDFGTITSPGYPGGWSKLRRCLWKIRVSKGRRIKVKVEDFDFPQLETHTVNSFLKSRVAFYNDLRFSSIILQISNETLQRDIYSSDNVMMIHAIMTVNNGRRGLKLSYSSDTETICKGCLFDGCQSIIPPAMNLTSYYCEYQTEFNEGTLSLEISDFYLIPGNISNLSTFMCNHSPPLKIISLEGEEILRLCDNSSQKIVSLPAIASKIEIVKNRHNFLSSFKIKHKHHACGGVYIFRDNIDINLNFTAEEDYGPLSCVWQVKTNNDEVGHFTVSGFLKFKLDCGKEYLIMYNGPLPGHPLLNRYCGEQNISNTTLANGVFLHYQTSNYNRNSTLKITIKHPETCGGRLIYPFRIIDFRDSYKNDVECIWTVEDLKGYQITAEFVGRFYIESSNNCQKDFIQITDNSKVNPTPPLRTCGRDIPPIFISNSNSISILFRSDDQVVGDGFSLKFGRKCGGLFPVSEERRYLHSPNYPRNYDANLNCNYTFVAKENEIILLRFLDLQIETGMNCGFDNLTIYLEDDFRVENPRTYCTHDSLHEIRHTGRITVKFQTDISNQAKGFALEYGLEDCGGIITAPTKIHSPRDKILGTYSPNMICIWNITAPVGEKIVVKFEEIDFEYSLGCDYDRVEIFDGNRMIKNQRRAILCGNLTYHAPTISLKQNKAIIYSNADNQDPSKGFSAVIGFSKMCDKDIDLNSTGPEYFLNDFLGRYDNNLDCNYIFKAPEGYHVQIEFILFHVAPCSDTNSTDCICDFVEIRDGSGPFSEPMGTFCGHAIPSKLLTTKQSAFVRFHTDSATSSTGFNLKVSAVENVCGKSVINLDDQKGNVTIQLLGSGNYLPYMRCEWEVFSEENDIHLHFEKLDIQDPDKDGNCTDVLIIYNEESANVIPEGLGEDTVFNGLSENVHSFYSSSLRTQHEFCGNRTPHDYYANSKKIFIKFISDDQLEKSGFRIIASKVEDCFKNYTSTQGRIVMKGVMTCDIYITTNENTSISLYYKEGDMSFGFVECSHQKIEVFNLKSNQRVQQICGEPNPTDSLFTDLNQIKIRFSSAIFVSHDITFLASKNGPGCGGELYNYEGIFTSPFYPINARNNSDCRWDIRVPQNLIIALKFDVFDMGSKTTCLSDYLQIIEIKGIDKEEVVRQFCGGDTPKFYLGERNFLSVRFRKTVNYDGTGWVIRFNAAHKNSKILED